MEAKLPTSEADSVKVRIAPPDSAPLESPPDLAIRKRLAANIRRLASEQGLSITALARKSGASRTQLYNMQRYRCSPTIETLYLIAAALGTDISVLLAPEDSA